LNWHILKYISAIILSEDLGLVFLKGTFIKAINALIELRSIPGLI